MLTITILGIGGFFAAVNNIPVSPESPQTTPTTPTEESSSTTTIPSSTTTPTEKSSSTTTPTEESSSTTTPSSSTSQEVRYDLSTSVNPQNGGSISPSGGTFDSGSRITLTATPAPDYKFDSWSGNASGINPTITITVNSYVAINANFSLIRYDLSTSVNPQNGGSISPSGGTFDSGSRVTLTATPTPDYEFDSWSGDASGINPTITITVSSSMNIFASFVPTDTDGDGLTNIEERQIGTNPNQVDSDYDGLNDYDEVKNKGTDPLNADSDFDGVIDGDDIFPTFDAYVKVDITYFEDTSAPGVYIDGGLFPTYGEPYFKIWVDDELKVSYPPTEAHVFSLQNPYSALFNVTDDTQTVSIRIEVWDSDLIGYDDQYDVGNTPGDNSDSLSYRAQFYLLDGTMSATSNGAADGSLAGGQARINIMISVVY